MSPQARGVMEEGSSGAQMDLSEPRGKYSLHQKADRGEG